MSKYFFLSCIVNGLGLSLQKKYMIQFKQLVILSLITIGLFSCSSEDVTNDALNESLVINAFEPKAKFDAKRKGIYVGSIISVDLQYHSKVLVNAGNNGLYSAKSTINDVEYFYTGTVLKENIILFKDLDNSSTFKLDISSIDAPVVSDFTINEIDAHMVLQKRSSSNMANVLVGNYTDINDVSFTGTFDVFTAGEPHPFNPLASKVTSITNVAPGGAIFTDNVMETFDFAICTEDVTQTDFEPLMFVNNTGTSAHFYADNQTSTIFGIELTWQLFHFINDGYYIQFENIAGFEDGCYETASGLWGWNGRFGVINFDFSATPTQPGLQVAEKETVVETYTDSPIALTSEMIQAILNN